MKKIKTPTTIKVKKEQQINQREVKVISACGSRLLAFDVQNKGRRYFIHYNTEGLISLFDFLKFTQMNKRCFVFILRNLGLAINEIQENHFSHSLIVWSLNSCYVDPTTWRVYLMYIPLQPYELDGDFKNFVLDFVSNCNFESEELVTYAQELVLELNRSVSYTVNQLEDFCDRISDWMNSPKIDGSKLIRCSSCHMILQEETICPFCGTTIKHNLSEKQTIASKYDKNLMATCGRSSNNSLTVWLENVIDCEKILIEKFPFHIGKTKHETDFWIDNNAVSRKHADILMEQGQYYIFDLGSTNGTFLDGKRIPVGAKVLLNDGMIVSFANAQYRIHII